ncbi:MAG: sulfite exporter TauE/SafE family protein [Acidobacteriaceae bacterium]
MESVTLHILVVLFLATIIRSTFGFGEALFAVPLLALRIPVTVAAPLAVLVSITIAVVVVAQDWRHVHLSSVGGLLASTVLGIPVGLMLLKFGNPHIVKVALALVLISFSAYSLCGRALLTLQRDSKRWLFACGFCAGILGGAYGMNGPPLVLYGAMRRWSPQQFRATLHGYFLPASIIVMTGYWFAGLWTPMVTHDYLWSVPVILPAIWLGRIFNRRMHGDLFLKYVYLGLATVGCALLLQAIHR